MLDPRVTLAVVLAVGAALALLVWALFRGGRITRPETLAFRCPFKDRDVTVEFQEDAWNGALVDVRSCDVFTPPTAVRCDKGCLRLAALPARAA